MQSKFRLLLALENDEFTAQVAEQLTVHYDIQIARSAEDVYHRVHDFQPWLAVLDYNLTSINPIELHEGVEFLHPDTKFVICVTEENLKVARLIWCKRAIDYIRKPVGLLHMCDDINKIVRHIIDQHDITSLQNQIREVEEENEKLRKLL